MKMAVCAAALAIVLAGCGGGSGSSPAPTPPAPVYPSITGNWSIAAFSAPTSSTILIGAYLSNTNGAVSGVAHILNSTCYQLTEDVPISGTITTAGAISLTSTAVNSQTIAFTGTISGGTLSDGTYTITGGCAAGDKGTVSGYAVPSFTNTYTGTFLDPPAPAVTATVTATQSGPSGDGTYQVSGTATFTGSPCLTSGTIVASVISGGYFAVTISSTNGSTVDFVGDITDSTGKTIQGEYLFTAGSCAGASGSGTLSHP